MNRGTINTIFFGSNSSILRFLIKNTHVKSIFCGPEDTNNQATNEIKEVAREYLIPVNQPKKGDLYNYIEYINNLNPDLIVVCSYKYVIPGAIFNIPKFRTVNIHPSFLPQYRGQHVINWAIINGEKETGVTVHFIDEGIDTGDIINQKKVQIMFEDTAKTLHDRIYCEACELIQHVFNNILNENTLSAKKQDNSKASYFRPRNPGDGIIDWGKDGIEIYNLIRALVKPWPGAYSYIKGKKIIFRNVLFEANLRDSPIGEIIDISDSKLVISVKNGKLLVDDYEILDENGNTTNIDIEIHDKFEKGCDGN